ncbi:MAG: polyketide synthase dehydratase domain-containing protein [Leptolyngbyaceae cyanobacterium MAG.088]|nr:polyketide synthase dehydratase domain-containing protein [Leptolyngbyaceae cyanobacterium MAG.088]
MSVSSDLDTDIAIIGMAALFPGAKDLQTYWQNIFDRVDAVRDGSEQWSTPYYDPDADSNDRLYTRRGGFVEDLADFNPMAFGIMPNSLEGADPDHFLALRLAQEALTDAGYGDRDFNREGTGIILGRGTYVNRGFVNLVQHGLVIDQTIDLLKKIHPELSSETVVQLRQEMKASLPPFTAEMAPGMVPNVVTGRIANRLGLMGPNYVIDAACSSSLVAVEMGIQELLNGRCDLMLAGGVHVPSPPQLHMIFAQLGALSRSNIRPFDKDADGTLLSEGCGILVLKRRRDAERDQDRIYALVKGIGVSSDGKALGLLAPRFEGEVLALERAYYGEAKSSQIDPATIGLVEAHGTGIPLGDRTEIQSLASVFGNRQEQLPHRALGSVKSMIGHCTIAAGAAGLIKSTLALHHKILPPTLCDQVNPDLGVEKTSFYINNQTRPWIHGSSEVPRRAAVNAFGFGGINAHAILEEYNPAPTTILHKHWPTELMQLSAESCDQLVQTIAQIIQWADQSEIKLADLAVSLAQSPCHSYRLALVVKDLSDLKSKLNKALNRLQQDPEKPFHTRSGIHYSVVDAASPIGKIAFLFPGEGAQYPNMLADLCLYFPQVRQWLDFLDQTFSDRLNPPSRFIFPPPTSLTVEEQQSAQEQLFTMDVASETVFTASLALNQLLQDASVPCDLMVGHSTGETSALIASEVIKVLDKADLGKRMRHLNQLYRKLVEQDQIPKGVLLAVGAFSPEKLETLLAQVPDSVHFAMDNCPNQAVLFAPEKVAKDLEKTLHAAGAICQKLPFDRAYHTPLFNSVAESFETFYQSLAVGPGRVPLYSCSTTDAFPEDPEGIRTLAAQQWSSRVRFRETITKLYEQGVSIFVEVGPSSNLTSFVDDVLKGNNYLALSSNLQNRPGLLQFQQLLGRLWTLGVPISTEILYDNRDLKALSLNDISALELPAVSNLRLRLDMPIVKLSTTFAHQLQTQLASRSSNHPSDESDLDTQYPPQSPEKGSQPESNPSPAISPRAALENTNLSAVQSSVVTQHFGLMQEFLGQQASLSGLVCGGDRIKADRSAFSHAKADSVAGSEPQAAWPMLGEVLSRSQDSLYARRRLNLQQDPFLRDHTLGSSPSRYHRDWTPLPVLPFTGSLEIVAEAASYLTGGLMVVEVKEIRGFHWVALDQDELVLEIQAQLMGGVAEAEKIVQVTLSSVPDDDTQPNSPQKLFEGKVVLASTSLATPDPLPFTLSQAFASRWSDRELYTRGMFHGPLFQGVKHIYQWGPEGIEANVKTLLHSQQFFYPPVKPLFQLDMVMLDAATQLAAFWVAEQWGTNFHLFPFHIQSVVQYQSELPKTAVRCRGQVRFLETNRFLTADFDFLDDHGRVVSRIIGLQSLYFPVPVPYAECRLNPQQSYFSEPWLQGETGLICRRIANLPSEFFSVSGSICPRALVHLMLMPQEREFWYALPETGSRRIDWLLGRIAAKDVVRQWASESLGVNLAPIDVGIFSNDDGKPVIYCPQLQSRFALPNVSLIYQESEAVAVLEPPGFRVGLDFRNLGQSQRDQPFDIIFSAEEKRWLSGADVHVWLSIMSAKEAASNAVGLRFLDNPQAWQMASYMPHDNQVVIMYQSYKFEVKLWLMQDELLSVCRYPQS